MYKRQVSLAAPLALLDDPLAAVDPSVGKHLLDACVFGALKKCGVVLATHSRQVLHRADAVLVLDSSGTALGFSRWHNLPDEALALVRVDDEDDIDEVVDAKDVIVSSTEVQKDAPTQKEETREVGDVSLQTWWGYARRAGPYTLIILSLIHI